MYPFRRLRILCTTRSIILMLLVTVMTGVTSVVVLRAFLNSSLASEELQPYAGVICGLANSVLITVLGMVWQNYSVTLNNLENYATGRIHFCFTQFFFDLTLTVTFQYNLLTTYGVHCCDVLTFFCIFLHTDTEWEDALILKTFIFSFINNYAGCFFIMFIQVNYDIAHEWLGSNDVFVVGQCGQKNGGCMRVLGVNLVVVFVSKLIFGNLGEVITICKGSSRGGSGPNSDSEGEEEHPTATHEDEGGITDSTCSKGENDEELVHPMERDHLLPKYTTLARIYDYLEVIILFGFVCMFIISFPAACLLPICLFAWQLELVIDSTKICTGHRKGLPKKAEDIGIWEDIVSFMVMMSLVSNSYQLCYVAHFDYTLGFELQGSARVWCFGGLLFGGYLFLTVIERIIPPIPADVQLQIERTTHLASKLIFNRPGTFVVINGIVVVGGRLLLTTGC